jgi:hypothetical protein
MVPLMHVMSFPQGVILDLFLGSSQMSQPTSHPTTPPHAGGVYGKSWALIKGSLYRQSNETNCKLPYFIAGK